MINVTIPDDISRSLSELDENSEWITAQVAEDLADGVPVDRVRDMLKRRVGYGFDHRSFDRIRSTVKEQDDFAACPFEAEEGVVECFKCGGKRVISVGVQTRAADEPTTTVAFCVKCKNRWTQNG